MASPFNIVTCSRLGLRNLPVWAWALWTLKVHKIFTKAGRGPLVKRILCLRPAGVINCRLSFWASWFPRGFCSNMGGCCKPRGSPNSFLSAIWGQILFFFVLFCFDFSDWIFIIVFPFGSPRSLLEVCKGWWLFHACLLILARYNSISLHPWLCTLRGFRVEKSSLALEKSWGAHQRKCFIPFSKGSTWPQGLNSRLWCLPVLEGGFSFFFIFVLTAELSGKPRNDFREPRFLHFPIHRKPLKSLPRNACFLIAILWWSRYLIFLARTPIHADPSLTRSEQSPGAIGGGAFLA